MEAQQLARIFSRLGLVFLVLFAVLNGVDALPVRLLDPDWILSVAAALANTVTIPLVAIAFIHFSGYLSSSTHQNLQRRAARLAALLALLFLITLPMLGFAVIRNARNLQASNQQTLQAVSKKGSELRRAVQEASSFADLKAEMQRLGGPQIGQDAAAVPLPELKKQLLAVLARAQAAIPARLIDPNSPQLIPVYRRVFRTSLLAILSTIAFALLAWDPVKAKNIFIDSLTSFKLFGVAPGSLRDSFKKTYQDFQANRKQSANRALMREASVKRERELRKLKLQQERDQKRNLAERRKQEKLMEQQRRKQAKQRDR